jgi:uncharacterized protein (DUF362 family)/Pyruvate/2-oxoacid:ferredoxin oxidoreductase delta subunit
VGASVAVCRCSSYDRSEVEDAVARGIELLGGTERLFGGGARVLVKPNFLSPRRRETRVTTDPEVVRAIALAAGGPAREVVCGDSPGVGTAARVARASGLAARLEGTPVGLVEFTEPVARSGVAMPRVEIAREAASAGVLVNVPKMKTHPLTGLTLAVKNLLGCVPGTRKAGWHLRAADDVSKFARVLVEVAAAARARLHVLDAVVAMEGNGPGSGEARRVGCLVMSEDASALDRAALEIARFPERAVPTIAAARRLGWGETELARIDLVGDDLASFRGRPFLPAAPHGLGKLGHLLRRLASPVARRMLPRPEFSDEVCRDCASCVERCPAGSLARRKGAAPAVDRATCILCFTCQEVCPRGAVGVRPGLLGRIFG